jgi:hypothetical protein
MARKSAAVEIFTADSVPHAAASRSSITVVLPHRFCGDTTARRGVITNASMA